MSSLFLVICFDNTDVLELRQEHRPRHMAHIKTLGDRLKMAGPHLDAPGGKPRGSFLLIEGESQQEVEDFVRADPFWEAGIFKDMEVRPWNAVVGAWVPEELRQF